MSSTPSRSVPRRRPARLASLTFTVGLALSLAAPVVAVDFSGSWHTTTFGTSGPGSGKLTFDGLGNASFLFTTSSMCGVPGNYQVTLTGPVDKTDYSWTGSVTNHPVFGNLTVSVDPDGVITGSSPSVPAQFGGRVDFTGQLTLEGSDIGLTLDTDFRCGPSGQLINATWDLAGTSDCTPGPTTLCLNDDRFRVRLRVRLQGQNRDAKVAVVGTDDSGLFFFTNPNNWEMLVKVLDGCALNDRYWVFFAATTNVQFTLTVTDTQENVTKTYTNPQGQPANAITDTLAFATCP